MPAATRPRAFGFPGEGGDATVTTYRRCPGNGGIRCARLITEGRRCDQCSPAYEASRTRAKREIRPYTARERARRAGAVAIHRRRHGDWCPGWGRDAHDVSEWSGPLTAEHAHAVAAGGSEGQPLTVLCRSCNSRKGSRTSDA